MRLGRNPQYAPRSKRNCVCTGDHLETGGMWDLYAIASRISEKEFNVRNRTLSETQHSTFTIPALNSRNSISLRQHAYTMHITCMHKPCTYHALTIHAYTMHAYTGTFVSPACYEALCMPIDREHWHWLRSQRDCRAQTKIVKCKTSEYSRIKSNTNRFVLLWS